jgi:hypothetical protein
MNAVELLTPDGKPSGAWMCGACHHLHLWNGTPALAPDPAASWKDDADALATHAAYTRQQAERCCEPRACDLCGKPTTGRYEWRHAECWPLAEAKMEADRFEKATKVPLTPGMSGPCFLPDGKFREALSAAPPGTRYVWPAVKVPGVDVADAVEGEIRDNHPGGEEFADDIGPAAWAELRAFGAEWWARHGRDYYTPDYKACVLLAGCATGGKP